ncbi:hypothetical protein GCM10009682_19150 [Luedemannella flava]|uniref:Uncharacterized protein n=1 Tax=Luedemannella flava TaxID=349316 RepID=A0ABN2LRP7_9ACTN
MEQSGPGLVGLRGQLCALATVAVVAGFLPSFSVGANALVAVVGVVMCWLGPSGRLGRRSVAGRPSGRGALLWLVPLLLVGLVELYAFSRQADVAYPTLSLLADPVLGTYPGRVVGCLGWLVGFWWLARR